MPRPPTLNVPDLAQTLTSTFSIGGHVYAAWVSVARVKVVVASFTQPAAAYRLPSSGPRRPSRVLN